MLRLKRILNALLTVHMHEKLMIKSKRIPSEGLIFLALAQAMVSMNIVFSKYIITSLSIFLLLTLRFSFAAFFLFSLHQLTKDKNTLLTYLTTLPRKDWIFIFGQALCAGIFFNGLMLWGLQYTDANVAGVITSALPAVIVLLSWLLLKEKISAQKLFFIALATIGLIVIACDKIVAPITQHAYIGDALILGSLLPEAMYYVFTKMHPISLPIFLLSAVLNAINACIMAVLMLYHGHFDFEVSLSGLVILALLSMSTGFFYVFWHIGSKKVSGVITSLSTAIMPLATVLLAWIVLGEQLTMTQFLGGGLVIVSIVMSAR